jgi:hypothetical protein
MTAVAKILTKGLPPERHADRVVAEMLRQIVGAKQYRDKIIGKIIAECRDGNPRAQEKLRDRITRAGAPFIITSQLSPGKRGRYELLLLIINGYDARRKELILPSDPIPEKPWLATSTDKIMSLGRGKYESEASVSLLVTHHALSRVAQRCGAKTIVDLMTVMLNIIGAYGEQLTNGVSSKAIKDGSRMRFEINETQHAYAVLNHYDDGQGGIVVATIVDHPEGR